ncbi:MAG TPA: CPBP family intramembrane glutamic endopeptidase [Ktedonobacterales bacterium]|nr:CPBP family intramembrane glutamic endopeptidase [Ktedonobacterales bacterium]
MPHPPTQPAGPQSGPQSARQPTTRPDSRLSLSATDMSDRRPSDSRGRQAPTAEGAAPWIFRQTLQGTALTLLPWLALAFALAAAPPSASGQPSHRLAPALDAASGALIFVISAALEGIFILAPLYYALRPDDAQAQTGDADETAHDWRARLFLASERLGLTGWAAADESASSASAEGNISAEVAERGARRWRTVWLTLGLAVATLAASALYSYALTVTHAPIATNSDALAQQAQTAPLTTLGSLLAAVFVAPLCEEVFFRAFLFRGLLRGMPLWPAILVSSLLFAIAHADLGSFIPLLIIGVALAFARSRARSLWPSVAIHTINNLVAALLILPTLITALGR